MNKKPEYFRTSNTNELINLSPATQFTLGEDTVITFKEIRQILDEIHKMSKDIEEIKAFLKT